jgi:predicted amidohydrolase
MWSRDPADLFCQLYDGISDRAVVRDRGWRRNARLAALSADVRAHALELDLQPRWLDAKLDAVATKSGEGPSAARWAAARGLDSAFEESHPVKRAPAGSADVTDLGRLITSRYDATGRFDTGELDGALLPKLVELGRRGELTANRAQAFSAVHRVPPDAWASEDVKFGRIESKYEPTVKTRGGEPGIVVACAPMLESLDEIELRPLEEEGAHLFTGRPLTTDEMKDRIRTVLRRMDDSGAMFGICPELSLSETLLAAWQDAAKESDRRYTTTLEWIFVGSGPFPPGGVAGPSCNHGVLIHRKTTCVAHEQDKLFPFTLMPSQIEEWGLGEIFSTRVDEHMQRGERLLIRETHWGRIAVLICEDLAKLLEAKVGRLVADFGVSLLIAPVFSKEVKKFFWEHQQARAYADQVGTQTVVANSLVVPRAAGEKGDVGTCLANVPGAFEIGASRHADQISVFWLSPNTVEVPSTHPVATDRL